MTDLSTAWNAYRDGPDYTPTDDVIEAAALEWLRNYHGSIDSTALLMAFRAGANMLTTRSEDDQ